MSIDRVKVDEEAQYDEKFILRMNTGLSAKEVTVQYKRLLDMEQIFRAAKSMLNTQSINHWWDTTIKEHVFYSFLGLVLAK